MFCPTCGNQIPDSAKFCPRCGNAVATVNGDGDAGKPATASPSPSTPPLQSDTQEPAKKSKKKKSKKGKKKWIVFLLLLLLAALLGGGAVLWLRSPAYQVQSDLKNGAYTEALSTYNNDVADNLLLRLVTNPAVSGYINQVQKDYEDGSLDSV